MKKRILVMLLSCMMVIGCSGCGETYEEVSVHNVNDYFTTIAEWEEGRGGRGTNFIIMYDNNTKVKYLKTRSHTYGGDDIATITPLYNSDGSLQIYEGE